jgi:hypothetical protein
MVWSTKTCIFNRHALYTAKPQCCCIESLKKIACFFICVDETFREGISELTIATKSELSMWRGNEKWSYPNACHFLLLMDPSKEEHIDAEDLRLA